MINLNSIIYRSLLGFEPVSPGPKAATLPLCYTPPTAIDNSFSFILKRFYLKLRNKFSHFLFVLINFSSQMFKFVFVINFPTQTFNFVIAVILTIFSITYLQIIEISKFWWNEMKWNLDIFYMNWVIWIETRPVKTFLRLL